jgi:AAA+ ATPase superfamily predicted ATPase
MSFATIRPEPFFNRTAELRALDRGWKHGTGGNMAMVFGRRRLGKTYLLQRYFTTGVADPGGFKPHCYYLAEQSTAEVQRLALAEQLLAALPSAGVTRADIAVSWNALLRYLSQQVSAGSSGQGRFALILDEFPHLVSQTPELPSILQAWWDREGVHIPLYVILCGSQLSVMSALGRESEPLYARFNAGILKIEPLPYDEIAAFYQSRSHYGLIDILLMYGILGGTPRYHAMVDPTRPVAEEIVSLLMQHRAVLENEARYLLSSEQIRDPAPYNATLNAIASGQTRPGQIQQATGIEPKSLGFYLSTLRELGWVRRELPFGETSDRRALYQVADPFLQFWYRFVLPLGSELQFSDPMRVFQTRVEPFLSDYMGWNVFESICTQWLEKHAAMDLGLTIRRIGRYWSRDGQTEIDLVAELDDGSHLFGECKWSAKKPIRLMVYSDLQAKVSALPDRQWRQNASYILFSIGGFAPEVRSLADSEERLHLVDGSQML